MTKVKICGNTNLEDVRLAISLGADYVGLIFAESKRKIDESTAHLIISGMPPKTSFVGVFANQPKQEVEDISNKLQLKILQFHGEETSLYCESFMEKGFQVIKTFRIKDALSLKRIDEYNVTAFLFDTFSKGAAGGTGITFDWNLLVDRPFLKDRFFLAGGLNPQNLKQAIETVHPFAVDVASGVEKSPGKKDPELLAEFIRIAKEGRGIHAPAHSIHP